MNPFDAIVTLALFLPMSEAECHRNIEYLASPSFTARRQARSYVETRLSLSGDRNAAWQLCFLADARRDLEVRQTCNRFFVWYWNPTNRKGDVPRSSLRRPVGGITQEQWQQYWLRIHEHQTAASLYHLDADRVGERGATVTGWWSTDMLRRDVPRAWVVHLFDGME